MTDVVDDVLIIKINSLNRWCGDKGSYASTESPGGWEPDGTQIIKWTAEGAVKCRKATEYSATCGIRNMPGIWWYPIRALLSKKWMQGGTADKVYSSLTEGRFCRGLFLFMIGKDDFSWYGGTYMLLTKRWRSLLTKRWRGLNESENWSILETMKMKLHNQ